MKTTRKITAWFLTLALALTLAPPLGGNAKAASLTALQGKWPEIRQAYKFMDGNVGDGENGILSLSLYMAMFL